MRGMSTPKKVPVNGKLASPLRSPRSAGGIIRCVCENNIDRGLMVQCEVSLQAFPNQQRAHMNIKSLSLHNADALEKWDISVEKATWSDYMMIRYGI